MKPLNRPPLPSLILHYFSLAKCSLPPSLVHRFIAKSLTFPLATARIKFPRREASPSNFPTIHRLSIGTRTPRLSRYGRQEPEKLHRIPTEQRGKLKNVGERKRTKRSSLRGFEGVSRTEGRKRKMQWRRDKLLVIGRNRSRPWTRIISSTKKDCFSGSIFQIRGTKDNYFRARKCTAKRAEYFVPIIWNKYI